MVTKEMVTQWMRQRIANGNYDTAASLAREFLDEHHIHNVLDPDFNCVINVGFALAPEIAKRTQKETPMKMVGIVKVVFAIVSATLVLSGSVLAGLPLTNLQGVGGVAFNPLAYPANPGTSLGDPNSSGIWRYIGKPQIGAWYVNLGESNIDWTTFGVAQTFLGRLELSYGYEVISLEGGNNIKKENAGAKLLVIGENSWDQAWLPAVSVGAVAKHTADNPYESSPGVDNNGYDIYAVATKLITQTPIPVLLSGGVVSTDSQTTGVLGYNDDRDLTWFGNVAFVLTKDVAVGVEYKQGAEYDDWKDADYWDVHLAWFFNPNTTLVAAYVNAGNEESSSKVGLGEGLVLSLQYAF